jgi:hypothetical protein
LALTEYRHIPAARDVEEERLVRAFGREIQLDSLSQLCGGYANNIVLTSVIGRRSPKDFGTNLLFVDLRRAVLEGMTAHEQQKLSQSSGPPELRTACNAIN